ncbi:MAG: porin family protein [Bacteroidales bacterium]|nr:porin family protein [Bacteroidales bacterium]
MKTITINIIGIVIFMPFLVRSQIFNDRYVNFKIGQGISYAGMGIAAEYRYKKLGIMGSVGFQGEQYEFEQTIPSSWNVSTNVRVYLSKRDGYWQFFTGVHAGWLSNYYHPDIGNNSYQYTVYGLAWQLGVEVREELLNFEIGVGIDPGYLTLNSAKHPYYNSRWYFSPSIGIGVNLYALQSRLKYNRRKIKEDNSTEHPVISEKKVSEIKMDNDTIHLKLIQQQASVLIEQCHQAVKSPFERLFYANDTLYAWKPLGNKRSIYVKKVLKDTSKEQFTCIGLNQLGNEQHVWLIYDQLSIPSAEELPMLMEELENYSEVTKGLICLYVRWPNIYLSLESLEFFNSDNITIKVDRLLICGQHR